MDERVPQLLVLVLGLVIVSCCGAQEPPAAPGTEGDTPARADGLVRPMIKQPKETYEGEQERLALVERAMMHRIKLLRALPPPIALCRRAPAKGIQIDGVLSPEEWTGAMVISDFRSYREFHVLALQTRAMMLWDSKYLYLAFECEDEDLLSTITEHDGDIWTEDTAEVFIDANGDGMSYIELEVNPHGKLLDAAHADYRPEIDWPRDAVHLDTLRGIDVYHTRDTHVAATLQGTLNNHADKDEGWRCEMAISWADIARGTNVRRLPPRDGDLWRVGLFRINKRPQRTAQTTDYGAWNPTSGWFHVPYLFGRVIFVE